eukprot:8909594-Pyramimonas_sp.AAC.1
MAVVADPGAQDLVAVALLAQLHLARRQFQRPEVSDVQLVVAQRRLDDIAELPVRGDREVVQREPDVRLPLK